MRTKQLALTRRSYWLALIACSFSGLSLACSDGSGAGALSSQDTASARRDGGAGQDQLPPPLPEAGPRRDSASADQAAPGEAENTPAACSDGISNDGDKHIDCNDYDCCGVISCPAGTACYQREHVGSEDSLTLCSDGVSNDGDAYVDCEDYDCCDQVACPAGTACFERQVSSDAGPPANQDAGSSSGITCWGSATPQAPAEAPESLISYAFSAASNYKLRLVLTINSPTTLEVLDAGYWVVELRLSEGQTDYAEHIAASSYVRDGMGRWLSFSWDVLELELTTLTFASAPGVCDGRLAGTLRGVEGPLASPYDYSVSFDLPISLVAAQLFNPNCAAPGTPYTLGLDCCSGYITYDPYTGENTCS